jgi:hypothetical protein
VQEVELLAPKGHRSEFTSAAKGRIFSLSVLEYIAGMLSNSVLHGAVGRELPCVCVCVLC